MKNLSMKTGAILFTSFILMCLLSIPAAALETTRVSLFSAEELAASGDATVTADISNTNGFFGFAGQVSDSGTVEIQLSVGRAGGTPYPVGAVSGDDDILTGLTATTGPQANGKFSISGSELDIP